MLSPQSTWPVWLCRPPAGTVKAMLPVGGRPLISYPLRNLAEAGIKSCIVVRGSSSSSRQDQHVCSCVCYRKASVQLCSS